MKTQLTPDQLLDSIEQYVDTYGLADILGYIKDICHIKSDHILESYNDSGLAKLWVDCADLLDQSIDQILPIAQRIQPDPLSLGGTWPTVKPD